MVYSKIYSVTSAVLKICNDFPDLPEEIVNNGGVQLGETDGRNSRISLYVTANLSNSTRVVCGYTYATYDIDLYYQIAAQNNEEKLNALNLLENLVLWLNRKAMEEEVGRIEAANVSRMTRKSMNGLNVFEVNLRGFF